MKRSWVAIISGWEIVVGLINISLNVTIRTVVSWLDNKHNRTNEPLFRL